MDRKERTVFVTILINGLLILFKFWLSAASGSLALRSSAIHSLADLAIGVFVLIGLFLSRTKLAAAAQNGARAVENWVALLVSAAIFYVGLDIVGEVLAGEPPDLRNLGPITLASLVTVVVAYVIARYKLYVGRQTDSPALIASGYHSRVDIYASIVVVAGLGGAALGLENLDTAAAAIVVVMIFLSGFEIAAAAITALRHREQLQVEAEDAHGHLPSRGWFRIYVPIASLALIALYFLTGIYTIQPGEVAVVRRFGKVIEEAGPGMHYRWPSPIETIDVVALDLVRRIETGPLQMLTGDENLISVRASIQFSVGDASAFVLSVSAPDDLVLQAGVGALRQSVGEDAVDAILTVDKTAIQEKAVKAAQASLDRSAAGIRIVGVQLLESAPPPEVADAFRDVASAREDRNTFVNEALAYRNEVFPTARGDADTARQAARAYAAEKLASSAGDAANFESRRQAYAAAPDITRQRLYLEAVEKSLAGAKKFVMDPTIIPQSTDLWITQPDKAQLLPPMQ